MTKARTASRPGAVDRLLTTIERVGNRLPEPFILFTILVVVLIVVSTVVAAFGVTVRIPGDDEDIPIRGVLSGEGIAFLFTKLPANFIGFPPMETVVTIMLGVGVAERTGLLSALIRAAFGGSRGRLLPYAVGVIGVSASVMADSSMIIIPPLAAMVFKAAGRHPVAGLIGGFAAAGAGYSTAPVPTSLDALFSGISNAVAETLPNPGTPVTPVSNYYFNLVSSIALGLLAGWLIDKVIEPRLNRTNVPRDEAGDPDTSDPDTSDPQTSDPGTRAPDATDPDATDSDATDPDATGGAGPAGPGTPRPAGGTPRAGKAGADTAGTDTAGADAAGAGWPAGADADAEPGAGQAARVELTAVERRGLRWAGLSLLVTVVALVVLTVWPDSPMRNETGGYLPKSPLMSSLTTLIFLVFLVPAIAYGTTVKAVTRPGDVPRLMGGAIRDLTGFLVLAFILGQFIALFNWTNIGTWLAVSGADLLRTLGLDGYPAFVGFMVLASLLNLFIISGSSLWTLMAAVFVPMFALLGFEPGFAQAAFRVGDSATQVMTPLNPYMIVLLTFLRRYEPRAGIGTLVARMVPFVVPFWVTWALILTVFYFADLPLGPGMGIHIGQ